MKNTPFSISENKPIFTPFVRQELTSMLAPGASQAAVAPKRFYGRHRGGNLNVGIWMFSVGKLLKAIQAYSSLIKAIQGYSRQKK
jgi:hypothetical protein